VVGDDPQVLISVEVLDPASQTNKNRQLGYKPVETIQGLLARSHGDITPNDFVPPSDTNTMPASMRIELFPESMDIFIDFYTRILNFEVLQRKGTYAYLKRDAIYIGAIESPSPDSLMDRASYRQPNKGVEIVFEVDDVFQERDRVIAAGLEELELDIAKREWGLVDFRLIDPDGYYIRITNRGAVAEEEEDPASKAQD
jgi:lactoylglutathione lyase